ncbi:MAG: hypothetical protein ACK4FK_06080 [Ferrovibrio sp.]|jgi:hypothetical protein|uniref:hypothetical protein n=1 Tax=Ferrovibrio sp. TaxID=1917215 RepID=UPI00391BA4E1
MALPPKQTPGQASARPPAGAPPRPLAPKAAPADDDAPEQEKLIPSELDDATHAEFRMLYDIAAQNVLFAKRQQWRVVEYFTLLGLALVAIGATIPFAPDVARFISGFLVFVGAVSVAVILMLQSWQGNEHAKMAYLVGDFSNLARSALRRKPKLASDLHRYFILAVMLLYIVVLDVVIFRLLGDIGR